MSDHPTWRLASDYVGAGEFFLGSQRAFVGTSYGVQSVPFTQTSLKDWRLDLGSRAISVRPWEDDALVATCLDGLFLISREGDVRNELLTAEDFVHPAVTVSTPRGVDLPAGGSVLTTTRTRLSYRPSWSGPAWEFDFRQALGSSVESVRLVHLFEMAEHFVAGVVDYDTGIGRVVVLDMEGAPAWMSEPGPLSELFPAGESVFVWCLTGYGRFETRLTRIDGRDIWQREMAGVGRVLPGGSVALLVGSNESPKWDNWELRLLAANGKVEKSFEGKGRSAVRPLYRKDGSIVFVGALTHLDPSSSRVDYTNFFKMPQEILFQHLVGLYEQVPDFEVYVQKLRPRGAEVETIYHVSGSYSLAEPVAYGEYVVFADGKDLVGIRG